jgi:signal transduction histidine kinase
MPSLDDLSNPGCYQQFDAIGWPTLMIPRDQINFLTHSLQNKIMAGRLLSRERAEAVRRVSESQAMPLARCVSCFEHMLAVVRAQSSAGAREELDDSEISRFLGSLEELAARARDQLAVVPATISDSSGSFMLDLLPISDTLSEIDTQLMDFRREWLGRPLKLSLREAIAYAAASAAGGKSAAVCISEDEIFDLLAANRFVRAFLDEALTNAWKHGEPPVELTADYRDREIEIRVADDGRGFDLDRVSAGQGLDILRSACTALGGHLLVTRNPTEVTLRLPTEHDV